MKKKNVLLLIGVWIGVNGWFWAYWETKFFGSKWYPSCLAELICDGVALILTCISGCFIIKSWQIK